MSASPSRRGVFPGSFNPLTVAHLDIAQSARESCRLDEVHLVISRVALDKPQPPGPSFEDRIALLQADAAEHDWLSVHTTNEQLIVDIAEGYDVVIMGADKWVQVNDVRYYDSPAARDDALARLPEVVVAERAGSEVEAANVLPMGADMQRVSSSLARSGARNLMAPKAAAGWHHRPEIRPCAAHELDIAASIYIGSRMANVPAIPQPVHAADSIRHWFTTVLPKRAEIWLADVDGAAVGVLALTPGWIDQLYVSPDDTGRGVGSALIRHAKSIQAQLDLWTFQSNTGAQRFYESHGFYEVDRTMGNNEEGAPDVRYRWVDDAA